MFARIKWFLLRSRSKITGTFYCGLRGNFQFRRFVTKRCGFAPLRQSRIFSRIPAYKSTTYFFTTP